MTVFWQNNGFRGCCKMLQQPLKIWDGLHPADVGAVNDRPLAITNRPYKFYCRFCVFCNTHFLLKMIIVRNMLHDVFNTAIQNIAKFIDGIHFNILIFP